MTGEGGDEDDDGLPYVDPVPLKEGDVEKKTINHEETLEKLKLLSLKRKKMTETFV